MKNKIDVKRIAELANLSLKEDEIPKFEKQLSDIVGYIELLNKIDTSDITPTSQVTGLSNVFREDNKTHESFTQQEALSQAKISHNGMAVVKQILEEK